MTSDINPNTTYCSGLRCGRKNICALWTHHLKGPFEGQRVNIAQFADHAGVCHKFILRVPPKPVLPTLATIPSNTQFEGSFAEDDLPLLALDIRQQTPQSFAAHVNSLSPALKLKAVREKRPKLTGRKTKNPTKKTDGTYLLELSVLETKFEFAFTKEMTIANSIFVAAKEALQCPDAQLREFLAKKKFTIS